MKLPISEEPVPTVCRMLRTKQAHNPHHGDGEIAWQHGASTTAVFWCLHTMAHAGPDDAFVHAHECRPGRSCYESNEG